MESYRYFQLEDEEFDKIILVPEYAYESPSDIVFINLQFH